jgi:hypothetical protein
VAWLRARPGVPAETRPVGYARGTAVVKIASPGAHSTGEPALRGENRVAM